ncbi:hypothetical protein [Magnetococcus sp. PR-3]|uniref:hypothetical protein n=1 Tax=Magnetococcus sp. PR-3 TaxID=3120355 RepID=UPI002FCE3EDD
MKKRTRKLPARAPATQDEPLSLVGVPDVQVPEPEEEVVKKPRPPFQLTLLLAQPCVPTAAMITQALQQSLPPQLFEQIMEEGDGSVSLRCFGRRYQIHAVDQPMAQDRFTEALSHATEDKELSSLVAQHQAHWGVRQVGELSNDSLGASITAAVQLMHLSAFVAGGLKDHVQAMGVYWDSSEMLVSWADYQDQVDDTFAAMEKQAQDDEEAAKLLPDTLWIGLHVEDRPEGGWCLSKGLELFTGYEWEMTVPHWDYQQVAAFMMLAVRYVYRTGHVLRKGEMVGLSDDMVKYFSMQACPLTDTEQALRFALVPTPAG